MKFESIETLMEARMIRDKVGRELVSPASDILGYEDAEDFVEEMTKGEFGYYGDAFSKLHKRWSEVNPEGKISPYMETLYDYRTLCELVGKFERQEIQRLKHCK